MNPENSCLEMERPQESGNEFLELIQSFTKSRESVLQANRAREEELLHELAALKEEICEKDRSEQELYDVCSNLEIEANRLEREAVEIGADVKNARNKWNDLNRRKVQASLKFAKRDVEFMTSIEKKLKAYKRLTGVYWDYNNCCETFLKGYVCNENSISPHKLVPFEYNLDDTTPYGQNGVEHIANRIWHKIGQTCSSARAPLVRIQ